MRIRYISDLDLISALSTPFPRILVYSPAESADSAASLFGFVLSVDSDVRLASVGEGRWRRRFGLAEDSFRLAQAV